MAIEPLTIRYDRIVTGIGDTQVHSTSHFCTKRIEMIEMFSPLGLGNHVATLKRTLIHLQK